MALFKNRINTDGGQSFVVLCPRCRDACKEESVHMSGEGLNVRVIEGDYTHECGYSVKVTEKVPLIQGEML